MTSTHEAFREWMMLSSEAASIITISDGDGRHGRLRNGVGCRAQYRPGRQTAEDGSAVRIGFVCVSGGRNHAKPLTRHYAKLRSFAPG